MHQSTEVQWDRRKCEIIYARHKTQPTLGRPIEATLATFLLSNQPLKVYEIVPLLDASVGIQVENSLSPAADC